MRMNINKSDGPQSQLPGLVQTNQDTIAVQTRIRSTKKNSRIYLVLFLFTLFGLIILAVSLTLVCLYILNGKFHRQFHSGFIRPYEEPKLNQNDHNSFLSLSNLQIKNN